MLLWLTFLARNFHFASSLFGTIASLIMVYVLYSSWKDSKEEKLILRAIGFLFFAVFLAINAGANTLGGIPLPLLLIKFLGLTLIAVSFYKDPLQIVPERKKEEEALGIFAIFISLTSSLLSLANLVLLVSITRRIYKKYSIGLEREFKNLYRGFFLLTISEFFLLLGIFSNSPSIFLSNLSAPFGAFFILYNLFSVASFSFILLYAWGYIRFKLFSQIVGSFVISSLFIFILIAFTYTSVLIRTMQKNTLENLKISLGTFNYAVERLKEEGVATASVIATNQSVRGSLGNTNRLSREAGEQMVSAGVDFLVIVGRDGRILARGEEPEATTGSLANNSVVSLALSGDVSSNIATRDWVNASQVLIEAASPIDNLGAIYTGNILDNAFVDGFKKATGLDVTVYAENVKSATTLTGADGVSRLVGAKQTSEKIKKKVLEEGGMFLGLSSVLQNEYVSAYGPIKNKDGEILGMFFVGYPSILLFEAAQSALSLTFYLTAILAIFSFIPAYLLARFIEEHQV